MKQVWSVGRVTSWAGFCLPCGRDDRPLVLTRSGATGLRAWVTGISDDERTLLLACRVCGEWDVVPVREEDDPEVRLIEDDAVAVVAELVAAAVVPVPLSAVPWESPPTRLSPDDAAVAAARSVLSAARAGQQHTVTPRPSVRPARRRGHRRGPTPRRPDHAARTARPAVVAPADATSVVLPLDLPISGHCVLVAG